ncbi:protein ABIL2-like isoform X2 [Cynara cardunculus var. scolymus]|uniref:protein ABIL2-like isoform X2 n=1 Tax=Cynara cardunculus var. scolymus TaxID=59895 RepID=UPI000D628328|nr:protein ABIL2-like isoform X2 [Cynara cardunculus var. scolymus]
METLSSSASMPFPREPANYDEIAMHQSLLFSDGLKDLKNLRKQLYSAAEFFELSYTNDDQKETVVDTLKDYAIKALVNTVDHLGAVSYKVNNLLDEKVEEVSGTELRVSCIEQRLRSCQEYFDHEGISQQSLLINIPKYFKRYVLPVGEKKQDGAKTKLKHQGCLLDDEDDRHEHKNGVVEAMIREKRKTKGRSPSPPRDSQQPELFSFVGTVARKDIERRSVSPRRFPLLRTGSFSSRSTPNSRPSSRSSTPNPSRPTTPTSIARQQGRKSVSSDRNGDGEMHKEADEIPSKSKRLLKALLSRRKSRKDDMLYTYLDEY